VLVLRARSGRVVAIGAGALACILSACSLIVDTRGLSGGAGARGTPSDAALPADSPPGAAEGDGAPSGELDAHPYLADASNVVDAGDEGAIDSPGTDALVESDSGPLDASADDAPPNDGPTDDSGNSDARATDSGTGDGGAQDAASVCRDDLSNIGAGDFHISLSLTSASTGSASVALLNQRSACGRGLFWDVHLDHGALRVETDDTMNYTPLLTTTRVDDGRSHDVLIQRRSGTLSLYLDGLSLTSAASAASFGRLPPLVEGSDVCPQYVAFTGTLASLCVASP
jgi:hypothetical protein